MDGGSQQTYNTHQVGHELNLPTLWTEKLRIKTFGEGADYESLCDVVELAIETKDHGTLSITALVVPVICNPLASQPIT